MENQNTPTPSGTPPGAESAGSGQPSPRRFLMQFTLAAYEEYTAPTGAAALRDAENDDGPDLHAYTSEQGPEIVAEWDPVADDWKDIPAPLDLSAVPLDALAAEIFRRDCCAVIISPDDLAEYWECDESGATHPGSRIPEPAEMRVIRRGFERWLDSGSFTEMMQVCRDYWHAEQARQLDAEKEGGSK